MRVALVEDDVLLARQYKRVLERAGHEVHHSLHAGAALSDIDEWLPEVIILDLLLPVRSGMSLLNELQSYEDTCNVPVIVWTSLGDLTLDMLAPYGVRVLLDKVTLTPQEMISAVDRLAKA